jgi:hypothetical protein
VDQSRKISIALTAITAKKSTLVGLGEQILELYFRLFSPFQFDLSVFAMIYLSMARLVCLRHGLSSWDHELRAAAKLAREKTGRFPA